MHRLRYDWTRPRQQALPHRNRPLEFRLRLDQFRQTFNPKLDIQNSTLQNSLAVKSSDHSWLLRRNFRFSCGMFAKR